MSKKVVILVEDELFKVEDMLLSIQSILFVAAKQNLDNAPGKNDTEICLLHVLGNNEKEDLRTFDRYKAILEEQQRELRTSDYGCELEYTYETVHVDIDSYPPDNWEEWMKGVNDKIEEISKGRQYSIVLDVILVTNNDKDKDSILKGDMILSQKLYQNFEKNCIPYTKYDSDGKAFRSKWADGIGGRKPYERFCLDGNVIHKDVKKEIYGHLQIGT